MGTTVDQIDALRLVRSEDEHLEFKEAHNRFDFEELVEYCVALANEGGGRMILGMTDKTPRSVVGTAAFDVPERTVARLHERLQLKFTFDEVTHPDGRVLIFHVPSRACYQHCCLRYVMNEQMTNQNLRERFKLPLGKSVLVQPDLEDSLH